MRREWSPLIKNRQWDELERIAKNEPSQILCDTVAELARGFTDKADKRPLKRILFFLKHAGYEPSEIEESEEAPIESKPFTCGFMLSADSNGDTAITYAIESKGRVRWLTAYVNDRFGIRGAGEDTTSVAEAESKLQRLKAANTKPYTGAEVPAEFALSRIAESLKAHPSVKVPSVIAFWRSTLDAAPVVAHPGKSLPAAETTTEERRRVVVESDSTIVWRLELGAAAPLLQELYLAQKSEENQPEEERRALVQGILTKARADLIGESIVRDHAQRLYDLAYLLSLRGDGNPGLYISAAQDLEALGPESDYARSLLDKTMVMLVETMKATSQKKGQPAPA